MFGDHHAALQQQFEDALGDDGACGRDLDCRPDPEPLEQRMKAAGLERTSDQRKLQKMDLGVFDPTETLDQRIGVIAGLAQELAKLPAFLDVQYVQHIGVAATLKYRMG